MVLACAALWPACGGATETGRLISRVFLPEDYRGESQMSDVVQTPDGLIYGATLGSVHEFDGSSWRAIPVPTSWIMDLDADASGRVYVTGEDELGLIEPDADGHMRYRSLVGLVPQELRPLGRLWTVFAFEGAVYWGADDAVLRWKDGVMRAWPFPDTDARRSLHRGGKAMYLCTTDEGLFRLVGEEWVPVSADPLLKKLPVAILDDWGAPGVLFSMGNGTLWRLDAAGVPVEWPTDLAATVAAVDGARLADTVRLRDGRLAILTKNAGVFVLDRAGRIDLRFGTDGGVGVLYLFSASQDREGGLWVGTAMGTVRIELDPSLTVFDQANGAPPGGMYAMARFEGDLYACGQDGLYRFAPGPGGAPGRFARVPEAAGFMPYDLLTHRSGLVVVGDAGLFRYAGGVMTREWDSPHSLNVVSASVSDPDRVFVGGVGFLHTLRWDGTVWRDEGAIAAVKEDPRTIVEDEHGVLWIGTPGRGVMRVRRAPGTTAWQSAQADLFDVSRGLPEGHDWVSAYETPLGPLFTHAKGVSMHDPATDRLVPARALADAGVGGRYTYPLAAGKGSAMWMQIGYPPAGETPVIGGLLPVPGGGWQWRELPASVYPALGFLGAGELNWEPGDGGEGVLWIQGQQSIVRCDLDGALLSRGSAAPGVVVRGVARGDRELPLQPPETPRLTLARDVLRLRFASPIYAPGGTVEYQHRLTGYDERWSEWSTLNEAAFTNLSAGSYVFEVRARRGGGEPGPATRWRFEVLPQWWQRWPVLLAFIAAAGAAVWSLVRWRVATVEKERARLEKLVHERTDELARERDRAEAANRAKTMFLASMSHELRTPLHAILGYSQLLAADDSIRPGARDRLQIVAASGQHLLRLINEVLDLSKIEAGKLELSTDTFSLPALLDAIADAQESRAAPKNLVFRRPETAGLPATVTGDAPKLRQVLDNLLGNAIKFTTRGEVRLSATPLPDNRVRFEVSDTGVGIAPQELRAVFQPFTQSSAGRRLAREAGVGLGLAIAQRLVALLGGELRVASTPGEGSRFWFEIPLPPVAAGAAASRASRRITGYEGPRRRVLAVDDVQANRDLFADLLAPLGFEVTAASSAEEALGLLHPVRPDLVLLDLRLPGMDGLTLARLMRADPRLEGVKILAASASVLGLDPAEAIAAGCDGFISKPFLREEFLDRVAALLGLVWHEVDQAPRVQHEALDASLLGELKTAAEMGDIVAMRRALARLRERHPQAAALVAIADRIDAFDTIGVTALAEAAARAP